RVPHSSPSGVYSASTPSMYVHSSHSIGAAEAIPVPMSTTAPTTAVAPTKVLDGCTNPRFPVVYMILLRAGRRGIPLSRPPHAFRTVTNVAGDPPHGERTGGPSGSRHPIVTGPGARLLKCPRTVAVSAKMGR